MDYQLIIIGSGPGGYVAAIRAAQYGLKVAVIEERDAGGTCLNRGCIPTKALLHAGASYRSLESDFADMGIQVSSASLDWERMHERKKEVVLKVRGGVEALFKGNGVEMLRGHGKLLAPGKVEFTPAEGDVQTLTADHVILASGSVPTMPQEDYYQLPCVINSDDILEGETKPYKSIAILGGGVIGVEFADFYNSIGSEVTLIVTSPRILRLMDKDLASNLNRAFKKKGIKVLTNTSVTGIEEVAGGAKLLLTDVKKDTQSELEVEAVLVAKGRHPNMEGLLADGVELEMNRKFVKVDENFQTSLPGVYAIGDLIGGFQLAHEASCEGEYVAALLAGQKSHTDPRLVPSCIYTSPEISSVGLTEEEAKEQGIAIKTGKYLMAGNGKSMIDHEDQGFIKFVVSDPEEKILGVQMICGRATDLISEFTAAIAQGLTVNQLLSGMRPHPTYCEGISEALESIHEMSIHTMPAKKRR